MRTLRASSGAILYHYDREEERKFDIYKRVDALEKQVDILNDTNSLKDTEIKTLERKLDFLIKMIKNNFDGVIQ